MLREIAVAAGSQKLIAGQVADLEAEGKNVKRDQLQFIHENKTAAILKSSVRLGAMSANADARKLSAVTRFGQRLGLAFQIIDDILDVTQTSEILGKSAGKDVAAKKATYPAVIGLEKSRAEARRLTRQAHNALSVFRNRDAEPLHALANYLLGARVLNLLGVCAQTATEGRRFTRNALQFSTRAQDSGRSLRSLPIEIQTAIAVAPQTRSWPHYRCTATVRHF